MPDEIPEFGGYQQQANQSSRQHAEKPYEADGLAQEYTVDDGVLAIPVAGSPGTPAKLILTHGGLALKRVRYEAMRAGAAPLLPQPQPKQSGEVRLGYGIACHAPHLGPDGVTPHHTAGVVATFAFTLPPEEFRCGALPPTTLAADQQVLTAQQFVDTIL